MECKGIYKWITLIFLVNFPAVIEVFSLLQMNLIKMILFFVKDPAFEIFHYFVKRSLPLAELYYAKEEEEDILLDIVEFPFILYVK